MHIVYDSPPRRVVAHRLSEADFFGVSGLFGKPNIGKHQNSTARRPGSNSPAARMPPNTEAVHACPPANTTTPLPATLGFTQDLSAARFSTVSRCFAFAPDSVFRQSCLTGNFILSRLGGFVSGL